MPISRRTLACVAAPVLIALPGAVWWASRLDAEPVLVTSGPPVQAVLVRDLDNPTGGAPVPESAPQGKPVSGAIIEAAAISRAAPKAAPAEPSASELVEAMRERYEHDVHEYRCTLTKQERVDGDLSEVQEIEIRYREKPHAVYMIWKRNADKARRALFMNNNPEFVDKRGRKVARVEPNGSIARLFVTDIKMPIDGPEAKESSRRSIAECGLRGTIDILEQVNKTASERGVLKLWYAGEGRVNGRPTYVIKRDLPYSEKSADYPDARMVLHIDCELKLPVAVYSYADHEEKKLLGSYVFTDIDLQPGFTAASFQF